VARTDPDSPRRIDDLNRAQKIIIIRGSPIPIKTMLSIRSPLSSSTAMI